MPYLKTTEQSSSLPLASDAPLHTDQRARLSRRIRRDDGGNIGRIDDGGALRAERGDGVLHDSSLRVVETCR